MADGSDVKIKISADDMASAVFEKVRANFDATFEGMAEGGRDAGESVKTLVDSLRGLDGKALDGLNTGMEQLSHNAETAVSGVNNLLSVLEKMGQGAGVIALGTLVAGLTKAGIDDYKNTLDQIFKEQGQGNAWGAAWDDVIEKRNRDADAQAARIAKRDAEIERTRGSEVARWNAQERPRFNLLAGAQEEFEALIATDVEKWTSEFNKALTAGGLQHGSDPKGLQQFIELRKAIKDQTEFMNKEAPRGWFGGGGVVNRAPSLASPSGNNLVESSTLTRGGGANSDVPKETTQRQVLNELREIRRNAPKLVKRGF